MKKIIAAAFWVLLAGSIGVQSCKKPDAAPDPTAPVTPPVVTPVDSTKTGGPTVSLTEPQIIQKAISQLSGKYLFQYNMWNVTDVTIYNRSTNTVATDTGGTHQLSLYNQKSEGTIYGKDTALLRFYDFEILNGPNSFYNKIFVNAAGDSFIGIRCGTQWCAQYNTINQVHTMANHANDYATLTAADFRNFHQYDGAVVDSGKYDNFFTVPEYEIQYFYNKDSLAIYRAGKRNTDVGNIDSKRAYSKWQYSFGYFYGKKIK